MKKNNINDFLHYILKKFINFLMKFSFLFFKYILFFIKNIKKIKFNFSPELVLTVDVLISIIVFMFSLFVSSTSNFFDYSSGFILKNLIIYTLISVGSFLWMETYKFSWKFFRISDLFVLLIAGVVINSIYAPLMFMISFNEKFPNLFLIFNLIFLIIFYSFPRFLIQLFYNSKVSEAISYSNAKLPVIICGEIDKIFSFFAQNLNEEKNLDFLPIFIISNNENEVGREINGIPVLTSFDKDINVLSKIIFEYKINNLLLISDFEDKVYVNKFEKLILKHSLTTIKIINKIK